MVVVRSSLKRSPTAPYLLTMLAFRMKRPQATVEFDKALSAKFDAERWGPNGRDLLQKASGMRERMKEASQSYSAKGADECREVMGRYQALIFQVEHVCTGLSLKDCNLEFKWDDAFEQSVTHMEADLGFERASVLFNLAAAISFLGNNVDRTAEGGSKIACNLYQQSAGALDECLSIVRAAPWVASADLSADTLGVLSSLMLAQAQKCFVEKAEADGMATGILAKLTAECAALYDAVWRGFEEARARGRPISKMSDDWLKVVDYNRRMWDGMQHFHCARAHADAHEYGKALARYTYAVNKTAEAVNEAKDAAPVLQEQFKRAHATCKEAYDKAKKDNDLVHYEKVPHIDTLPKPQRHCLVKPQKPEEVSGVEAPTPMPAAVSRGPSGALADGLGGMALGGGGGEPPPPSFEQAEEAGLAELVAMGFGRDAAAAALKKSGGSVQAAADLLLSQS